MAKRDEDDDKRPDSDEEEPEEGSTEEEEEEGSASSDDDTSDEEEAEDEDETSDEDEEDSSEEEDDSDEEDADEEDEDKQDIAAKAALTEGDEAEAAEGDAEEEGALLVTQLGAQRYVYSAFFASMILGGFVLGRMLETIWARVAVSDWAVSNIPAVTGVPDDTKATYSFLVAGVVAVIIGVRTFRKPDVRRWAEEVSSELMKVKWPSKKDVYASTVVVIATSAVAVTYLFLLDRFWGFITDKIYGIGS